MNFYHKMISNHSCRNCSEKANYLIMTPIGELGFCTESCFAIFMDLPVKEEGYYGLPKSDYSNTE
jgi:hypothetical protein